MRSATAALALGCALLLAACGQRDEAAPVEASPAPDAAATTAAPATPPAVAAATIPARFHGVWDAETGTCDPASDLRLDVGPDEIGFYESHGIVTGVTEPGDGSAAIGLAMEGEGEQWEATLTFALAGSGTGERLTVRHEDGESATGPKLKRCPA